MNVEIDTAMEQHNIVELTDFRGWVRSTNSRVTRQYFSLKSLSIEEWELRVESILTQEWKKFTGYILDVDLVYTGRYGQRRSIQAVDSPSHSPAHRRTRTERLEEQHTIVRDRDEAIGDLSEALITRWKCTAASCGNKGTCWIDDTSEHLAINAVLRER